MSEYPNNAPDNWLRKTLGYTLNVLTDYTANGSFESLKQNVTYYSEPNYAVLVRTTDLGKPSFVPVRFTDKRGYLFQRKTALYGGEIVLANVGSVWTEMRNILNKLMKHAISIGEDFRKIDYFSCKQP